MKKMFLLVPACALIFSCEKEEKEVVAENQTQLVSTERIDLNEPERPGEIVGGDRDDVHQGMVDCALTEEEHNGEDPMSGEKCLLQQYDECEPDANERCKSQDEGVGAVADLYLTYEEKNKFYEKTYDEQFVIDNWDFFMACFNAGLLKHPDEIIALNFR